ncbi:MAG: hypothetical protein K8T89_10150 [Planctomycetes bacterium]|nr:hypothetical protein [Planctomycetota bacterium]
MAVLKVTPEVLAVLTSVIEETLILDEKGNPIGSLKPMALVVVPPPLSAEDLERFRKMPRKNMTTPELLKFLKNWKTQS